MNKVIQKENYIFKKGEEVGEKNGQSEKERENKKRKRKRIRRILIMVENQNVFLHKPIQIK